MQSNIIIPIVNRAVSVWNSTKWCSLFSPSAFNKIAF